MKRIVVHQPHFLPWMGYIHKLYHSDVIVIQDDVQYRKRYYQNRTYLRSHEKDKYIFTVPVLATRDSNINEVKIFKHSNWYYNSLSYIRHYYHDSLNFDFIFNSLLDIFSRNHKDLLSLNINLLLWILDYLDIEIELLLSSEIKHGIYPSDSLLDYVTYTESSNYLFGEGGGISYHGYDKLKKNGINIEIQDFRKKYINFASHYYPDSLNLSILDLLFILPKNKILKILRLPNSVTRLTKQKIIDVERQRVYEKENGVLR